MVKCLLNLFWRLCLLNGIFRHAIAIVEVIWWPPSTGRHPWLVLQHSQVRNDWMLHVWHTDWYLNRRNPSWGRYWPYDSAMLRWSYWLDGVWHHLNTAARFDRGIDIHYWDRLCRNHSICLIWLVFDLFHGISNRMLIICRSDRYIIAGCLLTHFSISRHSNVSKGGWCVEANWQTRCIGSRSIGGWSRHTYGCCCVWCCHSAWYWAVSR